MDWEKETDTKTENGRKNFTLLTGDESLYLITIITLECCDRVFQYVPLNLLHRYFQSNWGEEVTKMIIGKLDKCYKDFRTSNHIISIDYFDEFFEKIRKEVVAEEDPVLQAKKREILVQFQSLSKNILPPLPQKPEKKFINRATFNYIQWYKAFEYARESTTIWFDLIPSHFTRDELNQRLKKIFDNIKEISKVFATSDLTFEIWMSGDILEELAEWKDIFKIPYSKVGKKQRVNLIRLMKYWEVNEIAIVDDWLGDDEWWTIKILNRTEKDAVDNFLFKINRLRGFLDEHILETRYEQELLAEMRWFDYTSISSDEIFLWKLKKLKATPQSIWSLSSTRWYSSKIADAILLWENVFLSYKADQKLWKIVNEDSTPKKQERFIFDRKTWKTYIDGTFISEVKISTTEYKFIELLSDKIWEVVSYEDLKKFINSWQVTDTDAKYCQKIKNGLHPKIKSMVKAKKTWYMLDLVSKSN